MNDPVVALVEKELKWFRELLPADRLLFPPQDNLYPISFFGNIRRAVVLTLALNPARTEFGKGDSNERNWPSGLEASDLTTRLLQYFELNSTPPHRWFGELRKGLEILDCSYRTNAAHIDLHPLPTKFRKELDESQRKRVGCLIEAYSKSHLADLLALADDVKLLLVVDYMFSKPDGTEATTFDFISTDRPIMDLLRGNGNRRRVFSAGGTTLFEERIKKNASSLRKDLVGAANQ